MGLPSRDQFGDRYAFVACLMRQPRGASNVSDGINPIDACTAQLVDNDVRSVGFDSDFLQAQIFDVSCNSRCGNYCIDIKDKLFLRF